MDGPTRRGVFRMVADAAMERHDWGATRVVCDPASTAAAQLTILEASFDPGGGHAFHRHPEQEEMLYVLSGRVEQWVDREMRLLDPGDSAFVPAGMVHASFTVGAEPARLLAIFGPCVGDGHTTEEMGDHAPWKDLRA